MMVQMAASNTILQTIVEEDKRGRVVSFYSMAFLGMAPFGSLFAGSLAGWTGAAGTVRAAAAACSSACPLLIVCAGAITPVVYFPRATCPASATCQSCQPSMVAQHRLRRPG
jgi:MFS family permease